MAQIVAISSITKVPSFLISFTKLSVVGSLNSILSTIKAINLLFHVSLRFPSPVAKLNGIGEKICQSI